MLKFEPATMPFHWYKVKNHSSGNIGNFNYRIFPQKDELLFSCWIGIYCYEKTKDKIETAFPLTEQGLSDGWQWLKEQFEAIDSSEIERPLTILDVAPYEPSQQEEGSEQEQAPF